MFDYKHHSRHVVAIFVEVRDDACSVCEWKYMGRYAVDGFLIRQEEKVEVWHCQNKRLEI